jgi:hypothetical protein
MSGISARPWWLGIGVIALGGVWLNGALRLDVIANYGGIGPGLFVGLVGAGLVLCDLRAVRIALTVRKVQCWSVP